jgi:hypothetical protein
MLRDDMLNLILNCGWLGCAQHSCYDGKIVNLNLSRPLGN